MDKEIYMYIHLDMKFNSYTSTLYFEITLVSILGFCKVYIFHYELHPYITNNLSYIFIHTSIFG